jgi:pimeloyl-ACP methyl ester carboxylesterase
VSNEPFERINADGVEVSCLTSESIADRDRPLVVCLHGFPDTAHTYRRLLAALDAAGFRVAAPFLRGYAPSAVPDDGRYQTGASSIDAIDVHDHFGGDARSVLVGHDRGAAIAYGAASFAATGRRWVTGSSIPSSTRCSRRHRRYPASRPSTCTAATTDASAKLVNTRILEFHP